MKNNRQLPELVENGYIYIAQPPLYKVKKGKQENYLKDDAELEDYLLQSALDQAGLYPSAQGPAIQGLPLEKLAKDYLKAQHIISRLSRRYNEAFLNQLLDSDKITPAMLNNHAELEAWVQTVQPVLTALGEIKKVTFLLNVEPATEGEAPLQS